MPVRNCCLGCQGYMPGPCAGWPPATRAESCGAVGPCCPHAAGKLCCSPCGDHGVIHGARGGVAGSFYSCSYGCIGGCKSGLCASCCGPSCS